MNLKDITDEYVDMLMRDFQQGTMPREDFTTQSSPRQEPPLSADQINRLFEEMKRFTHRAYEFAEPPAPPADDPYAVLGLPRSATKQEITRRYRQLAREHHPDRGGDATKMTQINNAYNQVKEQS